MSTTNPTIVFMFSGQGSQYFQMGQELFETSASFREWMERLDAIACDRIGQSIIQTIYAPHRRKADPFDRTLFTHPAIFMVEYALARCMMSEGLQPDYVLGVSLGSFAAAAIAGFLDAEEAMNIVLQQAIAIERSAVSGGMIAVMAPHSLHQQQEELRAFSEVAAVNLPEHFTLAAPAGECARIEAALTNQRITFQRLPVSAAFHSRWIDEARASFTHSTPAVARRGRLPLACCESTDVLTELPQDYFWRVIRNPIRFQQTISKLEQSAPKHYIDIGPAGTLATFLKYTLAPDTLSTTSAVLTQYGRSRDNIGKIVAHAKRHSEVPALAPQG